MAEENQSKELPQEQSLPSLDHQTLVSDGVDTGSNRQSLAMNTAPKGTWPDVVGLTIEEAEKRIREDMPMAIFQVILPDYFVTMDYNPRRVRLYVDNSSNVVRPPKIG